MTLTNQNGDLKGWVIAVIWMIFAAVGVFAIMQLTRDLHSEVKTRNVAIQENQKQKEQMSKSYSKPRPLLMQAYQGTDVNLIEIGGHEYIVATAYAGNHSGGSAVSVIHHAGCKTCNKEVNDGTR